MMSKLLQRLNVLAICLLSGVLASVLVARVWPGARQMVRAGAQEDEWTWPKTLQVYPSHAGDPVKLVRITKDGKELVPGTYRMPEIAGDIETGDAVREWLSDVSFTLKSQTSKSVVSVGIAVVFPVRRTGFDCVSITGESASVPWCAAHPHWCDGGCPTLIHYTLHWGLVPAMTTSGLIARYRAEEEAKGTSTNRALLQGKGPLRLAPGEKTTLSPASRFDEMVSLSDPRHSLYDTVNGIVWSEGIDEAKGTAPCVERAHSKTGCVFAEVPKFNVALDVVYFEDGTIWGNYGYGYALPNPDGIFTRVDARDFPGIASPASAQN